MLKEVNWKCLRSLLLKYWWEEVVRLCLPTKSLSLTASMLFRLMEAKSSSVRNVMDRGGQAWHDWSLNSSGCSSMQVTVTP